MKSVKEILAEVADNHGLTVDELLSKNKANPFVWARFEAMYRIFSEAPHVSYPEMGRRMGGIDPTTCLNGVRRYCVRNGISYELVAAMRKTPRSNTNWRRYGTLQQIFKSYGEVMENARHAV